MMKIRDVFLDVLACSGSALSYVWLSGSGPAAVDPSALLALVPAAWAVGRHFLASTVQEAGIANLGRFSWQMEDIVRSFLITGRPRTGKTATAVCGLLQSLFQNCPNWGGLCVDDKGLMHEIIFSMAKALGQTDRMCVLRVRPKNAPANWQPPFRYNLISNPNILSSTYAKTIVDVASSMVQGQSNPFFIQQAQIQIEKAIDALRESGFSIVSLTNVYNFLSQDEDMNLVLEFLKGKGTKRALALANHFEEAYRQQAPEQLSGVKSTIENFLHYFTNPAIDEVFCAEENSIDFSEIDHGKIICASLPVKYMVERKYVNTFLKLAFYTHGMERFDCAPEERENQNLLVLVADEAQHIVTAAESGMSDYNTIDKLPEAKVCAIISTQSTTSLIPAFGGEAKAKVFLLNLGTHIYFCQSDDEAAERAAKHIGKHTTDKVSRSYGKSGVSRSVSREDTFHIKPHVLRTLKRFECVIVHPEKGFQRTQLEPTPFTRPTERAPGTTHP
jgi:hypothetical protein